MHRAPRRTNKRKGDDDTLEIDEDGDERKEDKRQKHEPDAAAAAAAAASSSSAAAAGAADASATDASPAAAAAPCAASAAAPSSRSRDEVEDVVCSACHESFECADESARLPRTLPCGHPMCSACVKQSLSLTPGSVLCPHEHGQLQICVPAGVAAAAVSTVEGWLRLLPPRADLIASIKNQLSLMTRIGQQGARCSRPGCESAVTHYCHDCAGDLCSAHERTRHIVFPSHKAHTMPIALKASFLRDQGQSKLAGPAREIRARADALLKQLQQDAQRLADARKRIEAEAESNAKALAAQQRTVDRMRAADDETVLEMEAERLDAQHRPAAGARLANGATLLDTLPVDRVAALHNFLGPACSLSKATLLYRASRDGFKPEDWWRQCGGKSSLLMLIKVKGNGFVFGAFAPFQWPVGVPVEQAFIADPTGATFLFSLVNAHDRAVKLRLKKSRKGNAGLVCVDSGPHFGAGADLGLMNGRKSADSPDGNYTYPSSFEFDSVTDGGPPIRYDKTLLAGDDGRNEEDIVRFAAAEIETWQL